MSCICFADIVNIYGNKHIFIVIVIVIVIFNYSVNQMIKKIPPYSNAPNSIIGFGRINDRKPFRDRAIFHWAFKTYSNFGLKIAQLNY